MRHALRRGDGVSTYGPGVHIARDELMALRSHSLAFMRPGTPLADEARGFGWLWFGTDDANLADGLTCKCTSHV